MAALYNAIVPMYTVIIRRAFGVAGGAFANPEENGFRVAWSVHICFSILDDILSGPTRGIEAAYKRQLDATSSPEEREKLYDELLGQFDDVRDPLKTAHKFGVEEIIDPKDTRPLVCERTRVVHYKPAMNYFVMFEARRSGCGSAMRRKTGIGEQVHVDRMRAISSPMRRQRQDSRLQKCTRSSTSQLIHMDAGTWFGAFTVSCCGDKSGATLRGGRLLLRFKDLHGKHGF
ncbi:propionyl-CoA carboxylase [Salix suchowensis]|nr:propionyl-CoA carboxylase [Salix suchowensis]